MLVPLQNIQTDTMTAVFPAYIDPFEEIMAHMDGSLITNKLVDQVIRTPGREPSPQPVHFSVPGANNGHNGHNGYNPHRVLRSATVGYVAPRFEGKKAQMEEGQSSGSLSQLDALWKVIASETGSSEP
jgi:glutamate dehydrogenase